MKAIVSIILVIACTIGGYMAMGGHIEVLWQPFEVVIIVGSAIGAFVGANPPPVLKKASKAFGVVMKGSKYKKPDYIELLSLLYQVFRLIKSKGVLAIESHIENPHESSLFGEFPKFQHNHHAVDFLCDYLRMISLGADTPHVIEDLMNQELDIHHAEDHAVSGAIQAMADGMPALGIVAAVLGVIKTMGAITEPPEVLGHLIGGALVGTFLGVWVSYGFLAPIASNLGQIHQAESAYYSALKAGIIAYLQGCPPAVCVEFARKSLPSDVRPTFQEVDEVVGNLPAVK
jgi:chemotaxis protein MotA